ncbi:MAG: GGDEF domain-containing protein [Polyangiales bacterium]
MPFEPRATGAVNTGQRPDEDTTGQFPVETGAGGGAVPAPKKDRCTLTVLAGPSAGALFTVEDELVFGRGAEVSARIEDRGLSRRHAHVFRKDERFFLTDLGSTNGTFVNGRQIGHQPHELEEGDRVQMGRNVMLRVQLQDEFEQQAAKRLYESVVRDALTRVYNRRYLDERLESEMAYAQRHNTPLSVLLVDIDHFKQINDTHGHPAGDAVLRVVATAMVRMLRAEDVVARYGGEEFCVVARGIDARNAQIVGERIRRTIEGLKIPGDGRQLNVTVSVGVATFRASRWYSTVSALVGDADAALYRAKERGRNRVVCA